MSGGIQRLPMQQRQQLLYRGWRIVDDEREIATKDERFDLWGTLYIVD